MIIVAITDVDTVDDVNFYVGTQQEFDVIEQDYVDSPVPMEFAADGVRLVEINNGLLSDFPVFVRAWEKGQTDEGDKIFEFDATGVASDGGACHVVITGTATGGRWPCREERYNPETPGWETVKTGKAVAPNAETLVVGVRYMARYYGDLPGESEEAPGTPVYGTQQVTDPCGVLNLFTMTWEGCLLKITCGAVTKTAGVPYKEQVVLQGVSCQDGGIVATPKIVKVLDC